MRALTGPRNIPLKSVAFGTCCHLICRLNVLHFPKYSNIHFLYISEPSGPGSVALHGGGVKVWDLDMCHIPNFLKMDLAELWDVQCLRGFLEVITMQLCHFGKSTGKCNIHL